MSDMLKEFDRICRKYNIRYFLIGGSLIGVLAYKGWIPWDGDVDLEVCEHDYPLLETQNYKLKNFLTKSIKDTTADLISEDETLVMKSKKVISLMYEKNLSLIK